MGAAAPRRFWLVDPLDGTREFVKRNGEFCINIGLVEDGDRIEIDIPSRTIRLAVSAAKADGQLTDAERQMISDRAREAGVESLVDAGLTSLLGAVDAIRERFGNAAIGPASAIGDRGLRLVKKGAQQWGPDQEPR